MRTTISLMFILSAICYGFGSAPKKGINGYIELDGMPTMQKSITRLIFYTDTFPKPDVPIFGLYKVNECELAKIITTIGYFPESKLIDTSHISFFNYTIHSNNKVNRYITKDNKATLSLLNSVLAQVRNPEVRKWFRQAISDMDYYFM